MIVDEIHAVAPTKRGAHMALTLERLDHHVQHPEARTSSSSSGRRPDLRGLLPRKPLQRIGLSATQKPLERIAKFLVGPGKECEIVDAGVRKELDLEIVVPVEDMADPGSTRAGADRRARRRRPGGPPAGADRIDPQLAGEPNHRSIWPAIYPKLLELVQRAHLARSSSSTTAAAPSASPSG